MNETMKKAMLDAYSEKLAAEIDAMTPEEVQAALSSYEDAENFGKLAEDQEALGRFMHIGYSGGMKDFAQLLEKHAGDKLGAIAEFEEDLAKLADEVGAAEDEAAELLEAEESGGSEVTPEDIGFQAAMEADPEAMKTAMLKVLEDKGIGVFEYDAAGNPVRELALS
jgi:hypothetical protein